MSRPDANASAAGASRQTLDLRSRLSAWLLNHQLVAVETLMKLLARPASSLLTWLVIAIALTMPGALWMAVSNLEQLSGSFQQSGRITLYLQENATPAMQQGLVNRIEQLPGVARVTLIDADEALAIFSAESGLEDALAMMSDNPLPVTLLVEPRLALPNAELEFLIEQLGDLRGIDAVQLDMAWLERLRALLELAQRLIWVLGGLLALAILLVVGNTIRLHIAARVDEIRVVKLVGATNAYVRRPFLYTGLWYGMVGGCLSWVLLLLCWLLLQNPVSQLAALYGSDFTLVPVSADAVLVLILSAMLLGWLGAWWSVSRHLDDIEP